MLDFSACFPLSALYLGISTYYTYIIMYTIAYIIIMCANTMYMS